MTMAKLKCKIWYLYHATHEEEIEVEIPEGENPENYLYEHATDILKKHGCELPDNEISTCLDLSYAGVKKI